MNEKNRIVRPGKKGRTVLTENGISLHIPDSWRLLPPGDGPLTRLVKSKGPTWLVQVKKGRRLISEGIWADAEQIENAREELEKKRSTPGYLKRRESERARKEAKHREYVRSFYEKVALFLNFHPRYKALESKLAQAVTEFATPVGSGTVARTQRIPIEERAKSAVIAWLRHHTTPYDTMKIARIKGKRREIRRRLAVQSLELVELYRKGTGLTQPCKISRALARISHDSSD